jgi:formylglycine-generating enzyme required for sulfatase activity
VITENGSLKRMTGINWKYNAYGKVAKDLSQPVVFVTWNDAVAFTEWMSEKFPGKFRLPTEAEWEYAARGGARRKKTKYAGSDNLAEVAKRNLKDNPFYISSKKPNELSIYDMSGSVSEWCQDWYDKNYYRQSPKKEPPGPASGEFKVLRGGSWISDEPYNQVTFRNKTSPDLSSFSDGFRVVKVYK